jgi:hypothetical protein
MLVFPRDLLQLLEFLLQAIDSVRITVVRKLRTTLEKEFQFHLQECPQE